MIKIQWLFVKFLKSFQVMLLQKHMLKVRWKEFDRKGCKSFQLTDKVRNFNLSLIRNLYLLTCVLKNLDKHRSDNPVRTVLLIDSVIQAVHDDSK